MARKGNQQKNGLDRHTANHKKGGPDSGSHIANKKGRSNLDEIKVLDREERLSGNQPTIPRTEGLNKTNGTGDEKKSKKKPGKFLRPENQGTDDTLGLEQPGSCGQNSGNCNGNLSTAECLSLGEENLTSLNGNLDVKNPKGSLNHTPNRMQTDDSSESAELPFTVVALRMRTLALSVIKKSTEWLERHRPWVNIIVTNILLTRDYVRAKIEHAYPIVLRWLVHFANIMLLLVMVWLDCTLRGVDSVLRMGTTSFLTVIWCGILSLVAMIGMLKFFALVVSPL